VTPEVDIYHQVSSASVFVRSSGAGPALNVSWKVESQTLGVISSGEHPMLTDTSTVRYAEIDECGHMASSQYWSLEVHEGDRLESPLGLFGPTSWVLTDSSGSVSVTVEEEPRFWAIGSLEKLRDFATVAPSGDSLTVSVGFESLSGESYTRDTTVLIPEGRVLVRRDSDSLVVRDCQWSASRLDRPIEELLLAVVPSRFTGADQLKTPSGVDVLVERFQLDVGGLGNGEEMIASRNPDVFLNPRGALSVYLDLDRPANGTYDVELLVNGEPVESVMLEALVPPDNALRFKPEHVDWFRPDSSATETLGSSPR
jgi:hypothetical protein